MKTKDKILALALKQFNERGTDRVTVRSIADELAISPGNFAYHFKNTDALIEQLYLNLTTEMSMELAKMQNHNMDLEWLMNYAELPFRVLYKYKFLLLDFVRIMRRMESIRTHFRNHMKLQETQFRFAFDRMIEIGIMKPEWIPGMYENLIRRFLILGDAWIPHAEIHFDENGANVIQYYTHLFMDALLPFFTEEGLTNYQQIKEKRSYDTP